MVEPFAAFVDGAEPVHKFREGVAPRLFEKLPEECVQIAGLGGDLSIRLAGRENAADVAVGLAVVEKAFRDCVGVLADLRVVAAAGEGFDAPGELLAPGGAGAAVLFHDEREVGDRRVRHAAPAVVGDVHVLHREADADGNRLARRGRGQFERGVGDSAVAVHGAAGLDVVAHHDALHLASAGALRARHARGGVELDVAGGEDVVDGVEQRRLAGPVVAEKEEMSAAGQIDDARAEVVEIHEPDPDDPERIAPRRHYRTSSVSSAPSSAPMPSAWTASSAAISGSSVPTGTARRSPL